MFTRRDRANEYHRYLRNVPLFGSLSGTELDAVARAATDIRFGPDRDLVREGARATEMMIVTSGSVEVTRHGRQVAQLGPGDVVGELAVLSRVPRSATVTTTSDVEAIHLDADRFVQLLIEVPSIAPKVLAVVAARINDDDAPNGVAA